MTEFRTVLLESCLDSLIDYRGKSPPKAPTGIPVISAKVVKAGRLISPIEQKIAPDYYPKWMTRGLPKAGDIVMTTEGPLGEVAQLTDESAQYALGQRIVLLRGRPHVLDNTFLKFLLVSDRQQQILASFATGTTVEGISQKALRAVPLTLPDFQTQLAIASVLGALEDKIDLNRRMNETLEAMARAIFKDWFVDFGPVRAKAEGRQPPGLAPDIAALFPDALDNEDKPVGWHTGCVSDLASLSKESVAPQSFPLETFDHYSIPAYDAGQVARDELGQSILSNKFLVPPDTVLLSKLNPEIPRVWMPICGQFRAICSTEFLVFRSRQPANRTLLFCLFHERSFREQLVGMVTGTSKSHQRVQPQSVLAIQTVIPPVDLSAIFSDAVTPLLDKVLCNREEMETLAALRDLLLPKLMSGEIRIWDAEKAAEAAA